MAHLNIRIHTFAHTLKFTRQIYEPIDEMSARHVNDTNRTGQ